MPVAARATRWAPDRTRSTRAMLNVLSPTPVWGRDPFDLMTPYKLGAGIDPGPIVLVCRRLGNGRDLARALLRLPLRTLSRLVRRGLVGPESAGAGARAGSGRGDVSRLGMPCYQRA